MSASPKNAVQTLLGHELGFITEMKTDHIVVAPRSDIIREDEIGGPVYTLFEGWAIRYHRLPSGARQILDIVLPGDTVGIASAVLGTGQTFGASDHHRHPLRASGQRISQSCSPVTPVLALNILQTRVEEEQRMDIRLSLLGRRTAEQRIGYLMLETFDRLRQRAMVDGGSTCPFPAAAARSRRRGRPVAGACRTDAGELRERRLAEIQNGTFVIFDRPTLADLAGYIPPGTAAGRRALL